ncbi:MAG: hypothetical protein Q7O66_04430 [Dehalococcoidia bacterium]|nr:hypothetical protein [Dehalococcoidia bacterium]
MFDNLGLVSMLEDLSALVRNLTNEVISARVRTRALLEIIEEKGLMAPGEFDTRAAAVWERDYDELAAELAARSEQRVGVEDDEVD